MEIENIKNWILENKKGFIVGLAVGVVIRSILR